ncbi:MAG: peptidyl-alpha-hydroxyglycine alpha-amidating lyase family protein, partial [Pirellulales bacterium]
MLRIQLCSIALAMLSASLVSAADPYVSAGFLKLPSDIELGAVSSVAVDSEDNVYVLHRGEPPILAFDAKHNYVKGWGTGLFKVPHGLRVDGEDNIWTTDNGNHVLRKFNREGRLLLTLGTEGEPGKGQAGFKSPDDLVFDTQGNMYVADAGNGRIVKLSSEGKLITEWGSKGKKSGQFATAHGLAIDSDDKIYVADRNNERVQVFNSSGKHLANYTGFGNAFGLIAIGKELILSEGDIHKMFILDQDGKIIGSWGNPETLKLPHLM